MSGASSLRRLVLLYLSALVLGIVLLSLVGTYVFYGFISTYLPGSISTTLVPSRVEVAWIIAVSFISLSVAVAITMKLSNRILIPLNSVASSLREVAQGNLQARATAGDRALGETTQLVRDFNTMAERLQNVTNEQAFWNAAVAHELRTPVTILRGRLQGLADGVFPPNTELFNGLLRQVEGLNRLIEDLRVLSLNDSGHLELNLAPADLAQQVAVVKQAFASRLQAGGFTLHTELVTPAPVLCDAVRIRQALMALLENALKHAKPGALWMCAKMTAGTCYLILEDDGPGIPPDVAAHIFEAFRRGEPSRSRDSGGSGLGLAVVKSIAVAHGGDATCRPSGKCGTNFCIQWPLDAVKPQN